MLASSLFSSQSMMISGITMILGIALLRLYVFLINRERKPSIYDQYRQQSNENQDSGVAGEQFGAMPFCLIQEQKKNAAGSHNSNASSAETLAARRRAVDQYDVELLTLSRQIKAEIDTKIVALQLMLADANRVLQTLEGHVSQTGQAAVSPKYHEPDRVRIIRQEETKIETPTGNSSLFSEGLPKADAVDDLAHLNHIVVEDPFVESDFGFGRAMRELDELSAKIPTFDASSECPQPATTPANVVPPMPDWDTPMSYPIAGYTQKAAMPKSMPPESVESHPAVNPFDATSAGLRTVSLHETQTEIGAAEKPAATPVGSPTARKRPSYTNKILSQAPPQLDSLMTNDVVRKMGSKPLRSATNNAANESIDEEPLVPPMIPKMPPPSAQTILAEGAPYSPPENELDKIDVRKAKRHQLQYLISKGMSPKDIAAHLEMPVGEVELILSLHKRLADKAAGKTATIPPKGIIPAEHVIVEKHVDESAAENIVEDETPSHVRRFNVVGAQHDDDFGENDPVDDGEQVA